ncbi:dTMP kinase [Ahrensia sp. R2A130]|uniref:dTMP kinase n=1 Tax=Ahrensia sp. R2A130 TaxID=744979 RepID=UPI0001E0C9AD|nr:dTMP kinase [Ahrensia sp. R2A130]EFL90262.1 thymidylate kinase [Ahrensia sp. R2A130]
MRGHFITFEGGEGAGKSTQIKRLAKKLEDDGHEVVVTREPGGTTGAEAVRHVVLSGAAQPFGTELEAVLFAAARADNVRELIKPALARGAIVLCDRFMDSSRVYQGASGGVSSNMMDMLERAVTEDARPDLTLLFDLSPEEGLKRAADVWKDDGPDRYESEALAQQHIRRDAYLAIAKAEPDRCKIIDASKTLRTVSKQVDRVIDNFFAAQAVSA